MTIQPLVPMIELFKNVTFKIQGQSHSSRSHSRYNILLNHIPFVPCWYALPFLRLSYFKHWPWKSKVRAMGKVKVQSHDGSPTFPYPFRSMSTGPDIPGIQLFPNLMMKIQGQCYGWDQSWEWQQRSNIQSTHIPFVPCQSGIPFLSYDSFKIWPWKSGVKVMGEVTVQSHNVGLTSYRLTSLSFHVGPPIHEIQHFQNLTLKIQEQGQMTMMLHNYRSSQFHRTSNAIHPSGGFRDMGSAKSGSSAAWFDKFLAHGQAQMGQMGKWP